MEVFAIDFLLIIGFIVFSVLRAVGESNKKKQEYARRVSKQHPGPAGPGIPQGGPVVSEEYFPPRMPWEEIAEEMQDAAGESADNAQAAPKLQDSEAIYSPAGVLPVVGTARRARQKPQQAAQNEKMPAAPAYALRMTEEQIWQGIVWSEILHPPKCRRRL